MNNWIERNIEYTLVDAESQFSIDFAGMKFSPAELDAPSAEIRTRRPRDGAHRSR